MLHVEWYHVCWPRLTAKRVVPVVSISWASCLILDRSCPKTDGLRPHHWSEGALWAPQWGLGWSHDCPQIFRYFQHSRWPLLTLSYCIIVDHIKKWKILNPFNLESIIVHLVMLFDVSSKLYETKFIVGKWQVFTAGMRRGRWVGIRHLGNPPSSAGLRPHGP